MNALTSDDFCFTNESGTERSCERKAAKRFKLDKVDKFAILKATLLKYKIMRIRAKISY